MLGRGRAERVGGSDTLAEADTTATVEADASTGPEAAAIGDAVVDRMGEGVTEGVLVDDAVPDPVAICDGELDWVATCEGD